MTAEKRRLEHMPLESIQGAPRNPKRHAGQFIDRSIKRNGLVEVPTLDERTGRLVAGHGRIEALRSQKAAGRRPPDGVKLGDGGEWLVPILRGWESKSDAQAEAYLVASNQTTIAGGWADEELNQVLADLQAQDPELLNGLGFTEEELEKRLSDETTPQKPEPEFSSDLKFQLVVECRDERHQGELLQRFEQEGLVCRPLML